MIFMHWVESTAVLAFTLAVLWVPDRAALADQGGLDVSGYYLFVDAPPIPFRAINWVELWAKEKPDHSHVLQGSIRLNEPPVKGRYVNLELTNLLLAGEKLTFQSASWKGLSYRFSGRFLKAGDFSEVAAPGEVVLQGRLTKLQGRKVVDEAEVKFAYEVGD